MASVRWSRLFASYEGYSSRPNHSDAFLFLLLLLVRLSPSHMLTVHYRFFLEANVAAAYLPSFASHRRASHDRIRFCTSRDKVLADPNGPFRPSGQPALAVRPMGTLAHVYAAAQARSASPLQAHRACRGYWEGERGQRPGRDRKQSRPALFSLLAHRAEVQECQACKQQKANYHRQIFPRSGTCLRDF